MIGFESVKEQKFGGRGEEGDVGKEKRSCSSWIRRLSHLCKYWMKKDEKESKRGGRNVWKPREAASESA